MVDIQNQELWESIVGVLIVIGGVMHPLGRGGSLVGVLLKGGGEMLACSLGGLKRLAYEGV